MRDGQPEKNEISNPLIASTKAYTYPIYIMNDSNRPELVATCVAVSISGKAFLCTAAHAFHGIQQENRKAFVGISEQAEAGKYIELTEQAIYSTNGNAADFDLCLISAELLRPSIKFIDSSRFASGDSFGDNSMQTIQGFPLSRNKPTKSIDPTTNTVTSTLCTVGIRLNHSIDFSAFEKRKSAHIAFKYSTGYNEEGSVDLLHPKGMSGCGIWNIPTPANPGCPSLIGIFIEYHKNEYYCFATRARFIKDFAKKLSQ